MKRGIIKFLLIIIVAVLLLAYFQVDLRSLVNKYWPKVLDYVTNLTQSK